MIWIYSSSNILGSGVCLTGIFTGVCFVFSSSETGIEIVIGFLFSSSVSLASPDFVNRACFSNRHLQ
jgi:hypothetical protein